MSMTFTFLYLLHTSPPSFLRYMRVSGNFHTSSLLLMLTGSTTHATQQLKVFKISGILHNIKA